MITSILNPLVEQEIGDGENALAHEENHPRMMIRIIVLPVGDPLFLFIAVVLPNRSDRRVTWKQISE